MPKHLTVAEITWVGLLLNLLLGCVKVGGGWLLQSKALLADGAHSLLDLLTDIAVLVGLSLASKPEDESHHMGTISSPVSPSSSSVACSCCFRSCWL